MDVYEIVQNIMQISADAKDHPYGGLETGVLKREEGHPIYDSRVIDGFNVKINGNVLILSYNAEVPIKKAQEDKFEDELKQMLTDLASFIKKEFKGKTGKALGMKEKGEMQAIFQSTSRVRNFVIATQAYELSGIDADPQDDAERAKDKFEDIDEMLEENKVHSWHKDTPEAKWKRFLNQNKNK